MNYFAELEALSLLTELIAAIPGAIAPALLVLAVCLGLCVFVDRAVDVTSDDPAQT